MHTYFLFFSFFFSFCFSFLSPCCSTSGPVHQAPAILGAREYWEQKHGVDLAQKARHLREQSAPPGEQVDAFLRAGAPGAAGKVIEGMLTGSSAHAGADGEWVRRARHVAGVLNDASCPVAAARLLERTQDQNDLAEAVRLYTKGLAFGDALRCAEGVHVASVRGACC